MKKKHWFNILLYASFIFLFIALYNGDYFRIPKITSYWLPFVSFVFLLGGFLLEAFAWKSLLRIKGFQLSYREAIIASGLSVFTKYIPGKIMIVVSRSVYLNKTQGFSVKDVGVISLYSQLLNLLTGCVIGLVCVQFWQLNSWFILLFLACFVSLFLVCFSPVFSVFLVFIFKRWFKKTVTIPTIRFSEFLPISYSFFLFWFSYAFGFWLLANSLKGCSLLINDSLFYPSSMVAGVLALFSPGGIGIREGFLSYFLSSLSWNSSEIISLTITTRLWFLVGEVLFFLTSLLLKLKTNAKANLAP
ncbi:MAG: flippase-like domain-containing protein [Flavobacteriales bacterium]|nr:flippase-like domain-containing protein [Flavobacteriales bacterium]